MAPALDRRNNFDLIRLFAAFQVLFVHAYRHFGLEIEILDLLVNDFLVYFPGVPIFFFMSGYLVYASAERIQPNWRKYALHRAFRIFPALWACVILSLVLLVAFMGDAKVPYTDWLLYAVAQSTFFQAFNPESFNYFGVGTPNGSLWTIGVELQLYVLVPIILLLIKKLERNMVLTILALVIYASYLLMFSGDEFLPKLDPYLFYTFVPHLHYFVLGSLLYIFRDKTHHWFEGKLLIWALGFAVLVYFLKPFLYGFLSYFWVKLIQELLLSGLILAAAFTAKGLSSKLLKGNDYSYGIYIYHMLVINTILMLVPIYNRAWWFLVAVIVLSFLLAYFSWHFIEKRVLQKKKNIGTLATTRTLNKS